MNKTKKSGIKYNFKKMKEFVLHFIIYFMVNILLFLINYLLTPSYLWYKWPLILWSIGLAYHWSFLYIIKGKYVE